MYFDIKTLLCDTQLKNYLTISICQSKITLNGIKVLKRFYSLFVKDGLTSDFFFSLAQIFKKEGAQLLS